MIEIWLFHRPGDIYRGKKCKRKIASAGVSLFPIRNARKRLRKQYIRKAAKAEASCSRLGCTCDDIYSCRHILCVVAHIYSTENFGGAFICQEALRL